MKNQPQLEARVGHRYLDLISECFLDGIMEPWMVHWPFHVEDAPELIDLCVLVNRPVACVDSP
jgi:hypothetical protein